MKQLFSSTVIILLLLFAFPVFSQETDAELDRIFREMNRAYGFCKGQSFSLNRIQKEFPELQNLAKITEYEWNANFGGSCKSIEAKIAMLIGDKWSSEKEKLLKIITENLNKTRISKDIALAFFDLVKKRAKGEIEFPELATLLIFKPEFQDNPAAEMSYGFKKKYKTQNHSKAKGIDFQIQYPMSWKTAEAERPNIVQKFISENGLGGTSVLVIVKDIPLYNGRKLNAREKASIFTQKSIQEFIPEGGTFVSFKPIVLDAQKGGMLVFDQTLERIDLKLKTRSINFITIYEDKMITISGYVDSLDGSQAQLNEKFKKLEPLFKLIANSFVIQNQYK